MTVKPSGPARLLKVGSVVLISGAVLLLFGTIGAFYFWKGSDSHVSSKGGARGAGRSRGAQRGAGWRGRRHTRIPLGGARALGQGGRGALRAASFL